MSPAGKPWIAIQHVPWEGPGLIASAARRRGIALRVCRIDAGEPVPRADEVGGLIVLGGPMAVYDASGFPQVTAERELLRLAVARGLPVLGICLGAQLLAAAAGADVYPGPAPEIGFGTITPTAAGRADPLLTGLAERLPVFHWHGDTFDPPAAAVHLAISDRYPQQVFRLGRRAYGFQCHFELDAALAAGWRPQLPSGVDLDAVRRAEVAAVGDVVLDRFFAIAAAGG